MEKIDSFNIVSKKILVMDDDPAIRNLVHRFLSKQNYQVESAEDGATALVLFKEFQPDLVVLDLNLPDTTGFQLYQEMKSYKDVFVLILTSSADEPTIVEGFELGADDYRTKPFYLLELLARIRRIFKPHDPFDSPHLRKSDQLIFGDLVIDSTARKVLFKNKIIPLTHIQFNLLFCMASKPGHAWERSVLYNEVWNDDWLVDPKCIDVHVAQIRKKLRECGCDFEYITTVWKVGYKFEAPVENHFLEE
ncbi:response regulator transcription factor [Dapis sp. BLCC M126]|uniref:response regulator transcription factor n=1 Tax=Dapis sp. BLCC M126 TaxID=3400189 RepID=UPI003CF51821